MNFEARTCEFGPTKNLILLALKLERKIDSLELRVKILSKDSNKMQVNLGMFE